MRVETYSDKYFLDVVHLIEEFHKEAVGEYDREFNVDAVIETIKAGNPENCFLLLNEKGCLGLLYGMRVRSPMNGKDMFQEIMWYVDKRFRGMGLKLLYEVENILKSQGISIIIMAVLENSKTEKLKEFYEKVGYKKMETHYFRELN